MKSLKFFTGFITLITLTALLQSAVLPTVAPVSDKRRTTDRPNIVWIMAEDIGPQLSCYGDKLGLTPNIDRLAATGIRYTRAFTTYGVCAPSRNSIITGMYPSATGCMHMRQSKGLIPFPDIPDYNAVPAPDIKAYPEYLRASGYYCTNNVKTDYQFGTPFTIWDESSNTAHWRNRSDKSQPFLAVFTFDITHEINLWTEEIKNKFYQSQGLKRPVRKKDEAELFALTPKQRVKPEDITVPPYFPDTPLVREGMARYYDNIRRMDRQVGQVIRQLEEDGELDNTIIFFMGDNGNCQPRGKRWVLENGIHIPLILSGKPLNARNRVDQQLVSGIDFAPTALFLAGVPIPANIHGQVVSGIDPTRRGPTKPRSYIFAARDRMDNTYDMIRAVRDKRYKYIKNFNPEKPYTQPLEFQYLNPMMADILRLEKEGKLNADQQSWLFKTKPSVELYDIETDPHELTNLAARPEQAARIKTMDAALETWRKTYGDLGAVPEKEMAETMWPGGKQPITEKPALMRQANQLVMTCPTPGASIGYQIGESRQWLLYNTPISVAGNISVKAKAVRYGWAESGVVTATK